MIQLLLIAALMLGTPAQAPVPNLDGAADAYASYDAKGMHPDTETVPLVLDYVETVISDELPTVATVYGYFVVESVTTPGTFHIMRYSRLYTA